MKILKGIEKLAVDANPILSPPHLLSLALELKRPIWSNDKDFEGLAVKVYTTLDLIAE